MSNYDLAAYKRWDTSTQGGKSRLSHLELHHEQLQLMNKHLNQDDDIIDLGCGTNLYKKYYPNLIGIDVIDHPNVDLRASILEFKSEKKFDAALAFGSIQYYDHRYIRQCFYKMVYLVKPDGLIFFRALYHEPSINYKHLIFWDKKMIEMFTNDCNLDIIEPMATYPLKDKVGNKFSNDAPALMNMNIVWRKK